MKGLVVWVTAYFLTLLLLDRALAPEGLVEWALAVAAAILVAEVAEGAVSG